MVTASMAAVASTRAKRIVLNIEVLQGGGDQTNCCNHKAVRGGDRLLKSCRTEALSRPDDPVPHALELLGVDARNFFRRSSRLSVSSLDSRSVAGSFSTVAL